MGRAKIAISLDELTLQKLDRLVNEEVYPNRSRAIESAVAEKLQRFDRARLARECAKLDPTFEKALADEGLSDDAAALARILRGEIRWADLTPVRGREQAGKRPVLILSHDVFNERSGTVIAVALTSQPQRAGFPLSLERSKDLPKKSWVKISQIRTLSIERIGTRITRATLRKSPKSSRGSMRSLEHEFALSPQRLRRS
jgi:mRNA interferase MazF